jgi:hypothetical protein
MNLGLILLQLILLFYSPALIAEADGPDYWQVRDVEKRDVLNMRDEADFKAAKVGEIPHDASCIKNMGCKGGLTFDEFTTLSDAEKQQILKQRPRWCLVSFQGVTGWVAGRYLREGSCPEGERQRDASGSNDVNPYHHSYLIEKEKVSLRDGHARVKIPGTTAVIISEIIRRPVYADLTGDGVKEAVSVVLQHSGGSGTFYYLVAAVDGKLIESYFLGDRINITSIKTEKDIIIVEYLDRRETQPMASKPTIRARMDFKLVDDRLVLSEEL